jgi:hypothetical protein
MHRDILWIEDPLFLQDTQTTRSLNLRITEKIDNINVHLLKPIIDSNMRNTVAHIVPVNQN